MTANPLRRPADLDETLGALVDRRATQDGHRVALRGTDGSAVTYAELARRVGGVRALLTSHGLVAGDRVGMVLSNGVDYPIAWLGVVSAGMASVPINTRSGPLDAGYIINHSQTRLILADERTLPLVTSAINEIERNPVVELVTGHLWPSIPPISAPDVPNPPPDVLAGSVANIQYTSGTTGFPKGCLLSHRYWQQMGTAAVDILDIDADSVLLTAQPFSYLDPLWNTVAAVRAGAELLILDGFHPSTFMHDVARFGVTVFYCLATMPVLLLRQPPAPHDRSHRLQRVSCSAIPPALHSELEQRWGVPWYEVFGMTETGFNIGVLDDDHDELVGSGSLGSVLRHCEARVVEPDGHDVPTGRIGELLLRGTGMMDGYFSDQEATARFFAGGWAHTGDLVIRDQKGRFRLTGRRKDMIRRAGENVAAAEVEATLVMHPSVLECAVIPEPDDLVGEELRVIVVTTDGIDRADELHQFLMNRLARFKVPRFWEFRSSLPHTPSERVAKQRIGPPVVTMVDMAPRRP